MSDEKQTDQTPVTTPAATAEAQAEAQSDAGVSDVTVSDAEVIEQLRAELAASEQKAADYLDRLQRTAAEFQNSRRRLENQLAEETERANAALIARLLPVLDDFDLAFQNVSAGNGTAGDAAEGQEQAAWLDGFRQIQKKLLDVLAEQGVTRISTEGAFDPTLHDAVSSEPYESVPSGDIIAPLRAGYAYKGRVLRPALVRVAQ
ncbi:MAG: nucleotide exchange factor GrpE [Caldilineaceae bacterium]|nr:nucleotide exchange factor GrpE [Caldilineaceae bacterium]